MKKITTKVNSIEIVFQISHHKYSKHIDSCRLQTGILLNIAKVHAQARAQKFEYLSQIDQR